MPVKQTIAGRAAEISILNEALVSKRSEMIAILGRRRVGKTFLIREVYGPSFDFDLTGMKDASMRTQLGNFAARLSRNFKSNLPLETPVTWKQAFEQLQTLLESLRKKGKTILFFDELPWLATPKSGFLEALGYFWNNWAAQHSVVIVICGSAASWMIKKVVHDKGSLHNRITRTIHLAPFNLQETQTFFASRNISLSHYQVVQLYMVTGGIPFYLEDIRKGESVAQAIDRLCFSTHGLLREEFDKLYASLFDNADQHIAIVRALASKWMGMTRHELLHKLQISDGGSFTRLLSELETSDFISSIPPLDKKKKETLFRLTDNFSLFYLKFMEGRKKNGAGSFQQLEQMQTWKTWRGYAFENICLTHIAQIKSSLGIAGVYTEAGSYLQPGTKERKGAQVDMVINRSDGIMSLCEMKFYDAPFTISKQYAVELRNKREAVRTIAGSKAVYITLVTCFGVRENEYSGELLQNQIQVEQLFK